MIDIDSTYDIEYNDFVIEKLNAEEILNMVQQLPASYRTVFSLFAVEGYSHAEIAELLGINEGTSRSNLSKARLKLQEMMKNYMGSDLNENYHVS
jgi:RNA polymerase sigma-70 factor (ECF subfamily)